MLTVCFEGYAFCVKYAAPEMKKRKGGSVVNIASVSGFIAQPSFVPYNTSKGSTPSCVITLLTVKLGAIMQLTRCTAMDLGEYNIR
jgi:NAD(P)-dependent dehydrogenase (short-subunit alcohol dehydrogenase family)